MQKNQNKNNYLVIPNKKEYKALLEDIKIMRQQRVKALLDEQGI